MQKTIVTALAFLASTAVAVASDLPSKIAPAAPSLPILAQDGYIGVNVGGDTKSATVYSGGAVAGWNALSFLAVEGTYDLSRPQAQIGKKYNYENTVAINAVPHIKVPFSDITAYGFGGVGYRYNTVSTVADHSIYNVGGGLKYEFIKNIELDGRYTRIDSLKKEVVNGPIETRATLGVNYKF